MPKIILKSLFFFLLPSSLLGAVLFFPSPSAQAVEPNSSLPKLTMPDIKLSSFAQLTPTSSISCNTDDGKKYNCSIPWIAEYISGFYKYAVGVIGILATITMMIGGFIWLTAGGNASNVSEAKSWITSSIVGLVLVMSSYLLLEQINPNLTKLKSIDLAIIELPEELLAYEGRTSGGGTLTNGVSGDISDPNLNAMINATASKYGVDPALVKAIVMVESSGNPNAKSGVGAMGLMQLMPKTADWLGVSDPYDPQQNLNGGTKYIAGLLKQYGDLNMALAAYNWGPGNVSKKGISNLPSETQNYLVRVNSYYDKFRSS